MSRPRCSERKKTCMYPAAIGRTDGRCHACGQARDGRVAQATREAAGQRGRYRLPAGPRSTSAVVLPIWAQPSRF